MQHSVFKTVAAAVCCLGFALPAGAQTQAHGRSPDGFASENAILDTAVPFAIGAREARQALRGSFGWATFQEGLVEGVYFRFDPDGYARFSPTPRLDTDVFEVICKPRTFSCMARKDGLSVMLTSRGQLQLRFEGVGQGDRFFVSEGVSEIQIPERVLQPLDHQLEALLATGGELIVRRGDQTISNTSLKGFPAVATYLRWVLARQDYTVLPRGWPVPNSLNDPARATVTQSAGWQSPMPQPQHISKESYGTVPETSGFQVNAEVAEVRGELNLLRQLLLERQPAGRQETPPQPQGQMAYQPNPLHAAPHGAAVGGEAAENASQDAAVTQRLAELQAIAEEIRSEIDSLQSPVQSAERPLVSSPFPAGQDAQPQQTSPVFDDRDALDYTQKLSYLIDSIGLPPETAISVLQSGSLQAPPAAAAGTVISAPVGSNSLQPAPLYQEDVVAEILKELEQELDGNSSLYSRSAEMPDGPQADPAEFQLLTDYFKSVVLPDYLQQP